MGHKAIGPASSSNARYGSQLLTRVLRSHSKKIEWDFFWSELTMKTKPRTKKWFMSFEKRMSVLFLALSLAFLNPFSVQLAFALPEVDSVESGSVNISTPDSNTMNITASDKAIINYRSFSILQNESVIVNLPSSNSDILNRVTGNDISSIMGSLKCNGNFILINPNGITIGATANIDVAGLIAPPQEITN